MAANFRLTGGSEAQANYQWIPAGQTDPTIEFHFCKVCGMRTPGRGDLAAMGGAFYGVQVNLLDGVNPDELEAAPIRHVVGLHDRFDRAPADTRFL